MLTSHSLHWPTNINRTLLFKCKFYKLIHFMLITTDVLLYTAFPNLGPFRFWGIAILQTSQETQCIWKAPAWDSYHFLTTSLHPGKTHRGFETATAKEFFSDNPGNAIQVLGAGNLEGTNTLRLNSKRLVILELRTNVLQRPFIEIHHF